MARGKASIELTLQSFTLERMSEHDLLEVVEIEAASGLSCWGWEAYFAELARAQESVMLVARRTVNDAFSDGHELSVLGFIAARLSADDLHINNVAVRAINRLHGIGSKLLAAALEEGRRRGARRALLEVRAGNSSAQALYSRHDFKIVGRRRHYYAAPAEDALVMSREI